MLMRGKIRKHYLVLASLLFVAIFLYLSSHRDEENENSFFRDELLELMREEENQPQDQQKDLYSDPPTEETTLYPSDEKIKWMSSSEIRELWKRIKFTLDEEPQSKRLPDVIGIGAKKCGTGALATYLSQHPMVQARTPFEAHYFDRPTTNTFDQYKNSMPLSGKSSLVFEKTSAYFSFPPRDIPEVMKATKEDVKVLLILCNPSTRIYSDFVHETITGAIPPNTYRKVEDYLLMYEHRFKEYSNWKSHQELISLRNAILRIHTRDYLSTILTTGFYALHFSRWLEVFDASNIHIIDGDQMLEDPGPVLEKIQAFLGLPKLITSKNFVRDPNTGFFCFKRPDYEFLTCLNDDQTRTRNGKISIPESTLSRLNEFYRPFNDRLFEMIGTKFGWT